MWVAQKIRKHVKGEGDRGGSPVATTPLPVQEARVPSLVRELDPIRHNQEFACCN